MIVAMNHHFRSQRQVFEQYKPPWPPKRASPLVYPILTAVLVILLMLVLMPLFAGQHIY